MLDGDMIPVLMAQVRFTLVEQLVLIAKILVEVPILNVYQ